MRIRKPFFLSVPVWKTSIVFFVLIFLVLFGESSLLPENMYSKIFCGYQGWFGAKNDDPVNDVSWFHWSLEGTDPAPDTVTFDIWPDYTEYESDTIFFSDSFDWRYKTGERAGFYSSIMENAVLLHCKWMRDYGIDGVFIQRFTANLPSPKHRERMDNVLRYLIKGAETYDLKIAVMYDITGTMITEISRLIIEDWTHLAKNLKIIRNPVYQRHPDRTGKILPVVGIWGFGFPGEGVRGQAVLVTDFFRKGGDPDLHATILGGIPAFWRTQDKDSKPEYELIYERFDIISPWMVGRVSSTEDVRNWMQVIAEDLKVSKKKGQEYMPVSFPGFSVSNLSRNRAGKTATERMNHVYGDVAGHSALNLIPRDGGNFMWSQFYHWKKSGTNLLYIAMFDEVDEGTAIFKLAPRVELSTYPELFLTLDIDGYELKSDHYLWMAGTAGMIIKQQMEFPETLPKRIEKGSLRVRRNLDQNADMIDGRIFLDITLRNISGDRLEIMRKAGDEQTFTTIEKLDIRNIYFVSRQIIDESASVDRQYTYIMLIFDSGGKITAVSNMERPDH